MAKFKVGTQSIGARLLAKKGEESQSMAATDTASVPVDAHDEVAKEQPMAAATPLPMPQIEPPQQDNTAAVEQEPTRAKVPQAQKEGAASASEGKKEGKQHTASISARDIISTETKYANSPLKVGISKEFRNVVSALSDFHHVDISQIVNNLLSQFLNNEELLQEVKNLCVTRYKELLVSLKNNQK